MVLLSRRILVIAQSGRMLAQALNVAGLKPVVIDCFGDLDTQQYAAACYTLPSLALSHLRPALALAAERHALDAVIYGSGLECYPESLDALGEQFAILGNSPAVFGKLLDKKNFFKQLDQLEIEYPALSFDSPMTAGWLQKPMQGQGGVGIKPYQPALTQTSDTEVYWQKFQTGAVQSLSFLAEPDAIQIIGFNTQWCSSVDVSEPFQFKGIRTAAELPINVQTIVIAWAKKLAQALDLIGLNTLDFIYTGQRCYLLEINPRPSASMQLYPPEWLLRHIAVCAGEKFVDKMPESTGHCGYQVILAPAALRVPEYFDWPVWCMDIPQAGTKIATRQPICSIIAHEQCSAQLMVLLQMREQCLLSKLTNSI